MNGWARNFFSPEMTLGRQTQSCYFWPGYKSPMTIILVQFIDHVPILKLLCIYIKKDSDPPWLLSLDWPTF